MYPAGSLALARAATQFKSLNIYTDRKIAVQRETEQFQP